MICVYNDEMQMVATLTLLIRNKGNFRYASHDNLAVASKYKGQGIASFVFDEALRISKEQNLAFLSSSTATNAGSSVAYLKKKGFLIYQKSFGKGYNSYNYILPLQRFKVLRCGLVRLPIYIVLSLKNKIRYLIK